jgi:acyl carrier protein
MNNIEQEVVSIVSRIAKVPTTRLSPDIDLKSELNIDSLQGLQIIAALENRFGIVLRDEDLDNYTSIRAIVETITQQMPPEQDD